MPRPVFVPRRVTFGFNLAAHSACKDTSASQLFDCISTRQFLALPHTRSIDDYSPSDLITVTLTTHSLYTNMDHLIGQKFSLISKSEIR